MSLSGHNPIHDANAEALRNLVKSGPISPSRVCAIPVRIPSADFCFFFEEASRPRWAHPEWWAGDGPPDGAEPPGRSHRSSSDKYGKPSNDCFNVNKCSCRYSPTNDFAITASPALIRSPRNLANSKGSRCLRKNSVNNGQAGLSHDIADYVVQLHIHLVERLGPMPPSRANRTQSREIIPNALDLPAGRRIAFIEAACQGDEILHAKILELLADTPASSGRLFPGQILGQYRIQRLLGSGGFGETYLALDQKLSDRRVVIKLLHRPTGPGLDGFKDELDALAAVDHPGVVALIASGQAANGEPYLVMQFVDGESLSALIESGALDSLRVASILRQIGNALAAVHRRGILHRDLKPSNVMVQAAPGGDHVRLIDFGIARALAGPDATSNQTIQPIGSRYYMAPEQFLGKSSVRSDIFAMAVVAFELLSGSPPDRFGSREDGRPDPGIVPRIGFPSSLSVPTEALLREGLAEAPSSRPGAAAAYGEALAASLVRHEQMAWPALQNPPRNVPNVPAGPPEKSGWRVLALAIPVAAALGPVTK